MIPDPAIESLTTPATPALRAVVRGQDAPQAPRTGVFRRLLGPFYFTGVFWYRIHLFAMRHLPEPLVVLCVQAFTVLFYLTLGSVRRAVAANRACIEGPVGFLATQRRVFQTLRTYAWCLSERYEQFVPGREAAVEVGQRERWEELARSASGWIVGTAHVGNWELGSRLPASREGRAVHLVREAEIDARSQAFVKELLERSGGPRYHTHFASDDPLLGVELCRVLGVGDVVALQIDRPRAGGQVQEVRLCGRPFALPLGPVVLARLADVPILPVFTLRLGRRRYRLELASPIRVARSADRARDLREALEQLARELERVLVQHPEQWFCFREALGAEPLPEPARISSGPHPPGRD